MRKQNKKKPAVKNSARQGNAKKTSRNNGNIVIKKQYLKSSPICKITFIFPKEAAQRAQSVTIVGDFNNWNTRETPMKKLKTGDFKVTLTLNSGKEYRFRYLIDSNQWENDWFADKYIPNPYGCDDSVVVV